LETSEKGGVGEGACLLFEGGAPKFKSEPPLKRALSRRRQRSRDSNGGERGRDEACQERLKKERETHEEKEHWSVEGERATAVQQKE